MKRASRKQTPAPEPTEAQLRLVDGVVHDEYVRPDPPGKDEELGAHRLRRLHAELAPSCSWEAIERAFVLDDWQLEREAKEAEAWLARLGASTLEEFIPAFIFNPGRRLHALAWHALRPPPGVRDGP